VIEEIPLNFTFNPKNSKFDFEATDEELYDNAM
jgi:hypothetical protein